MRTYEVKNNKLASIIIGKKESLPHRCNYSLLLNIAYDEWLKFVTDYANYIVNHFRFDHSKGYVNSDGVTVPRVILLDYNNIKYWSKEDTIRAYYYEMAMVLYDELIYRRINRKYKCTFYEAYFKNSSITLKTKEILDYVITMLQKSNIFKQENDEFYGVRFNPTVNYSNTADTTEQENQLNYLFKFSMPYLNTSLDLYSLYNFSNDNLNKVFSNRQGYSSHIAKLSELFQVKNNLDKLQLLSSDLDTGLHSGDFLKCIMKYHSNEYQNEYATYEYVTKNEIIDGVLELLCQLYYCIGTNLIKFKDIHEYYINIDWRDFN